MTRTAFRATIEAELASMGWPPQSFLWGAPSKLVIIVNGQLRELAIHAGMSKVKLNRALGKLEGWADLLGLEAA